MDPVKCLVIEDSKNGVIAAKSAGMKCIGCKSVNSCDQDLSRADVIVDDFAGLDIDEFQSFKTPLQGKLLRYR